MFTQATKEAIKVGLAVGLSIIVAFGLGWEKSYWSVIAVFIVAANETYSHAIAKGGNRILGTLLGIVLAVFLLATFPQDRFIFILFLSVFLAVSVFMEPHKRFGYVFKMAFTVCVIIAAVGGFNSETSFTMAILRTQETTLGVVIYSLVFRFIWPKKTEDIFFETLAKSAQYSRKKLRLIFLDALKLSTKTSTNGIDLDEENAQLSRLNKLNDILGLSLSDSPRLAHEKTYWGLVVEALGQLERLMNDYAQGKAIDKKVILDGRKIISHSLYCPTSSHQALRDWCLDTQLSYPTQKPIVSAFSQPVHQRVRNAAQAVCIFLTCIAMWIYMPVPGAYIMPMLGATFANTLSSLPHKAIKFTGYGTAIWGLFFIAQYVFIMPSLTDGWQLAGLYFANAFLIWKLSERPALMSQKALAGNLSVIFPMSALQLTPSFSIVTPLIMLVILYISLGVISFYSKLFSPVQSFGLKKI